MSTFLGPLQSGRVPPAQQTRVGAFLISLHGALARRLTLGLPATFRYGWQTEWHSQLHRETEIAMLMMRATSWIPDLELPALCLGWEMIWVARPVEGIADLSQGSWIDLAALAHAAHGTIRPAALPGRGREGAMPLIQIKPSDRRPHQDLRQAQVLDFC